MQVKKKASPEDEICRCRPIRLVTFGCQKICLFCYGMAVDNYQFQVSHFASLVYTNKFCSQDRAFNERGSINYFVIIGGGCNSIPSIFGSTYYQHYCIFINMGCGYFGVAFDDLQTFKSQEIVKIQVHLDLIYPHLFLHKIRLIYD